MTSHHESPRKPSYWVWGGVLHQAQICNQIGQAVARVPNPSSSQTSAGSASLITARKRSRTPDDVPWKVLLFLSSHRVHETRSTIVLKVRRVSVARRWRSRSHPSTKVALAYVTKATRPTELRSLSQGSYLTTEKEMIPGFTPLGTERQSSASCSPWRIQCSVVQSLRRCSTSEKKNSAFTL